MTTLTIVVPCYNEEESLPLFVAETDRTMCGVSGITYEYLFIDDGSRDGTLDILRHYADQRNNVRYVSFSRNFGKEAAILAGLRHAGGDYIVLQDADLQHPPSLLPVMLEGLKEGYDCVAAHRTDRTGEPPVRSWFADRFYRLMNRFSDVKMEQGARDFRMMTRQVVNSLISLGEIERFSKGLFSWVGYHIKWIEMPNVPRVAGESKWSFKGLFKYAIDGIVAFSTAPLKLASAVGIITVIVALVMGIVTLINFLMIGITAGYSVIATLVLFFSGVIISLLGIIGEYIARIYYEVKRRPVYLIREANIGDKRAHSEQTQNL